MQILGKCVHGSRLYGLHSDSSDYDFKGILLPDLKDCVLMRATKHESHKAPEQNMEYEGFALQHFLRLSANAEDVTIAMLHAEGDKVIEDSDIYKFLRKNRAVFYTKRMTGALGYAKSMTLKYGYRADRMAAVEKVLKVLKLAQEKGVARLYQCWDDLPDGEHIYRGTDDKNNQKDNRYYEIAGKKLQATVDVNYAVEIIEKVFNQYGDRVKIAKNMDGTDFKALSHSFRVGYQLYEIYKNGGFSYPLPQSQFIKDVKYGKYDYLEHQLDVKLNNLITEVEELSANSTYPDKVDQNWMDGIVLDAYKL